MRRSTTQENKYTRSTPPAKNSGILSNSSNSQKMDKLPKMPKAVKAAAAEAMSRAGRKAPSNTSDNGLK